MTAAVLSHAFLPGLHPTTAVIAPIAGVVRSPRRSGQSHFSCSSNLREPTRTMTNPLLPSRTPENLATTMARRLGQWVPYGGIPHQNIAKSAYWEDRSKCNLWAGVWPRLLAFDRRAPEATNSKSSCSGGGVSLSGAAGR